MPLPEAEVQEFLRRAARVLTPVPERWCEVVKLAAEPLAAEEAKRVLAILKLQKKKYHTQEIANGEVVSFVEKVMKTHRSFIKRWGGMRLVGDPVEVDDFGALAEEYQEVYKRSRESKAYKECREAAKKLGINIYPEYLGTADTSQSLQTLVTRCLRTQRGRRDISASKKEVRVRYMISELTSRSDGKVAPVGTFTAKVRMGERTGAALLDKARKMLGEVFPEYVRYMEELLRMLGESLWTGQSRPAIPVISCAPSDFLSLGDLRCDRGSCFGSRGAAHRNRYNLAALLPGTFTLFFFRDGRSGNKVKFRKGIPTHDYLTARGWGLTLPSATVATNFYGLLREDLSAAYKPLLSTALGKTFVSSESAADLWDSKWFSEFAKVLHPLAYFNNDAELLYHDKAKSTKTQLPVELKHRIDKGADEVPEEELNEF